MVYQGSNQISDHDFVAFGLKCSIGDPAETDDTASKSTLSHYSPTYREGLGESASSFPKATR